jgi:hypothetical protein
MADPIQSSNVPGLSDVSPSRHTRYESPDETLRKADIALTNTRGDPAILAAMSDYGYNAARLDNAMKEFTRVKGLFAGREQEFGEQLAASRARDAAMRAADVRYLKSLEIARIAFEQSPGAQAALLLNGRRKRTLAGWRDQRETFYANLLGNDSFLSAMAAFGYTSEKLQEEQRLVRRAIEADAAHKREMGESQEATEVRDREFEAFTEWIDAFLRVAEIAIGDNPQWLEKIGLRQA